MCEEIIKHKQISLMESEHAIPENAQKKRGMRPNSINRETIRLSIGTPSCTTIHGNAGTRWNLFLILPQRSSALVFLGKNRDQIRESSSSKFRFSN